MHSAIGGLSGGLQGAAGAAISSNLLPVIGERFAKLNLPEGVREALTIAVATALGSAGQAPGAAAAFNQAANNYVSHSPFPGVRRMLAQENARLLNECGTDCTQEDFRRIDQQVAKLEIAANLGAISKTSRLTQQQAEQLSQLAVELMPIYGSGEALAQLITGHTSLTGDETSRLWAALGVLPARGILKKTGEASVTAIAKTFKKLDFLKEIERKNNKHSKLITSKNLKEASKIGVLKIEGSYSLKKRGPLTESLSTTFSGEKYIAATLKKDIILYRAGTSEKPLGQFFTSEPPPGVLQTRRDKVIPLNWPGGAQSPIDTVFAIKFPAGTKLYIGEIAGQGGFHLGGTQQIVIPTPWLIGGVEIIRSIPIK